MVAHFVIEPCDHSLSREDLILKGTDIALEAEYLSTHSIEFLTLAIQISFIVINRVLQLTDVLRFIVQLLSEAIILILELVYLAL